MATPTTSPRTPLRTTARLAIATGLVATAIVAAIGIGAPAALAITQTNILGPAGSGLFGSQTLVLGNGNFVVTDPGWDTPARLDVGAVYLYSGTTHQLISTLTGVNENDKVGSSVREVGAGNFVVQSPNWRNPVTGAAAAGAATWVNGATGLNGVVTEANSLVGSTLNDNVGQSMLVLPNGNYVVVASQWDNIGAANAGAAAWGSGAAGAFGVVSAANSVVGTTLEDRIGFSVTALTNGNYVVGSASWDSPSFTDVGAMVWANGQTSGPRTTGAVSTANSIYGTHAQDNVGRSGVLALTGGNYVVLSPDWDLNVSVQNVGAATLANGATGSAAAVSTANSLHGDAFFDGVGNRGVALTNGNYVVASPGWRSGPNTPAVGAATWRSGANTGILVGGSVTAGNSLIGTTAEDSVAQSVVALANGNYLVSSPNWNTPGKDQVGALTWGNGASGSVGTVSTANSLFGTTALDRVGSSSFALPDGSYVVLSRDWDNGPIEDAGAATWGRADGSTVGEVTPANSLVGDSAHDRVGNGSSVLSNGSYFILSSGWHGNTGAVTWSAAGTGTTGPVSAANSLVGDAPFDNVGGSGVLALDNGNFVVRSPGWDDGAAIDVGAATFGTGTQPITGFVSVQNSLVGSSAGDRIATTVVTLPGGRYLVRGVSTDFGGVADVGSVTFGSAEGVRGTVTALNSVLGISPGGSVVPVTGLIADGSFVVGRSKDNIVTLGRFDATPPQFAAQPQAITAGALAGATSAVVNYPVPVAVDDVGTPTVVCNPPPGSVFPLGDTTVTCVATNSDSLHAITSFVVTVTTGTDYVPLSPARVADSRAGATTFDGQVAGTGPLAGGTTLTLPITGRGGVPADAVAATLNVTATNAAAAGFLTVFPCGAEQPTASNLNFSAGGTIPNAVITKIGADGAVCVFAQQTTDVIVDVNGYFPPTTTYDAINPARFLDTRIGASTVDGLLAGTGLVGPASVTTLPVSGRAGVPSDAVAVVLNVTVTEPNASGFATIFPCGGQPPTASNLNYTPGLTIPNLVVAKIGASGSVCIFSQASTHLIADILGYFPVGTTYVPLDPARLLDSRPGGATIDGAGAGAGAPPAGTVTVVHVSGRGGVAADATSAVLNVTVTGPVGSGFATVYPCGPTPETTAPPLASNLNFSVGQTIPNAVVAKIGDGGNVCIFNSQTTHVIADVTGYFP